MDNERAKESTVVRGICSAILAMAMPTFSSLRHLLKMFGYDLEKEKQ